MLIINSGALRQGLGSARKHQNREREGERERGREREEGILGQRDSQPTQREREREEGVRRGAISDETVRK